MVRVERVPLGIVFVIDWEVVRVVEIISVEALDLTFALWVGLSNLLFQFLPALGLRLHLIVGLGQFARVASEKIWLFRDAGGLTFGRGLRVEVVDLLNLVLVLPLAPINELALDACTHGTLLAAF